MAISNISAQITGFSGWSVITTMRTRVNRNIDTRRCEKEYMASVSNISPGTICFRYSQTGFERQNAETIIVFLTVFSSQKQNEAKFSM